MKENIEQIITIWIEEKETDFSGVISVSNET